MDLSTSIVPPPSASAPPADLPPEHKERFAVIGEIAAEIAHELRNALQLVTVNVYLARQHPAESEPELLRIERAARVAQNIVDALMTLARGEPTHTEPTSVSELVTLAREFIGASPPVFDDHLEGGLRVHVHPGLVSRVLSALYDNSAKVATKPPARVTTRAYRKDGRVVVEVSDDGPGVAEMLAPRIFEPLVSGRPGGTGLGLALARRIVLAHGGCIELVPSDVGATFRIELPSA